MANKKKDFFLPTISVDLHSGTRFDPETGCFVLISPFCVPVSKNKKFMINMNEYRNVFYQTLDKAKKEYKGIMREQILALPRMDRVSIDYEIVVGDKRIRDGNNIQSVTSKFFLDALVEFGVIKDDNMSIVVHEEWNPKGYMKGDGFVEIYIRPV